MYTWYHRATVCYVYLSDLSFSPDKCGPSGSRNGIFLDLFKGCRWFTRGWTLQELLAPFNVEFYDKHWQYIGDKVDLADQISVTTRIHQRYITECNSIGNASVAARMSWASSRETTRVEDQAYCLMGLFGVNMPLLYGERYNAFLRLQHEIAQTSDDESLFAWYGDAFSRMNIHRGESGVFADRPARFSDCGHLIPIPSSLIERAPYAVTNKGLAIAGPYKILQPSDLDHRYVSAEEAHQHQFLLFPLKCASERDLERPFTIVLKSVARNKFVRYHPGERYRPDTYAEHGDFDQNRHHETIYIQRPWHDPDPGSAPIVRNRHFDVCITPHDMNKYNYALKDWRIEAAIVPSAYEWRIGLTPFALGHAVLLFKRTMGNYVTVVIGITGESRSGLVQIGLSAYATSADAATFASKMDDTSAISYKDISQNLVDRNNKKMEKQNADPQVQLIDGTKVRLSTSDNHGINDSLPTQPYRVLTLSLSPAIHPTDGPALAKALHITDVPKPVPSTPTTALVKIKAFGLNRMDLLQRMGMYPVPPQAPSTLGVEFSGILEKFGEGCTEDDRQGFEVGDEVFGLAYGGAYAEFIAVSTRMLMRKPEELSWEEAAGVPETFITATQALHLIGAFSPGKSILWHAGASSVSIAGIQLSKSAQASKIFVTASSSSKIDFCTNTLGATAGFNYKTQNWSQEVLAATDGKGVDIIVDFVGGPYFQGNLDAVAMDGVVVHLGSMGGTKVSEVDIGAFVRKRVRFQGSTLRARDEVYQGRLRDMVVEKVVPALRKGEMKVFVERVFPWEKVVEAHELMERNETMGKIICTVG
ncbi:MAG: hypothetical protein Q9169_005951 [Polycauliona sp. 2 TL-2023]